MIIYSPYISDTLPAFTNEKLIISYRQHPAVSIDEITGFSLMIKEYATSELLYTLSTTNYTKPNTTDQNGRVTFTLNGRDENNKEIVLKHGAYYLLQLGYVDDDGVFVYSEGSIGRCIGNAPSVSILTLSENALNPHTTNYQGQYSTTMLSEPLYSYRFQMFNETANSIVADSGTIIYNVTNDRITTDRVEDKTYRTSIIDFYVNHELESTCHYKISFEITTINGFTEKKEYQIVKGENLPNLFPGNIRAYQDNDAVENGYVKIELYGNSSITGQFILERSSDLQNWDKLSEFSLSSAASLTNFHWIDQTVEHGVQYTYALTQKGTSWNGITYYSERIKSNNIIPRFEYMFLSDGVRQLKLAFNPKVSSFKNTILESKSDTIGGKYPVFFRNGNVKYKEIPISGLISYHLDENEMFISKQQLSNSSEQQEYISSTDLIDANISAEKIFKLEVLEWLNNGELKLFRSPTEGNYVIRLMNISLTPEDTVGRMLHNFSATGYEATDANINTLRKNNLTFSYILPPIIQTKTVTLKFIDLFGNTNSPSSRNVANQSVCEGLIPGTIRNIIWQSIQNANGIDYIKLNNEKFVNSSGLFATPNDMRFNSLIIAKPTNAVYDDIITFTFDIDVNKIAEEDPFEQLINNSHNAIKSFGITDKALTINTENLYQIYAIAARADISSRSGSADAYQLTINDQVIDLSDGQIRHYLDIPVDSKIIKGSNVYLDLYVRAIGAKTSAELGKFVLGLSVLGQPKNK